MDEQSRGSSGIAVRVILILLVNLAFLIWLGSGVFMRAMRGCESYVGTAKTACESGNGGTPAGIVIFSWVLVDLILLVLWFVARHKGHRSDPSPA